MKRIWSGLKDKNGKKIMTGDTVKSEHGIDTVELIGGCFYPMGTYCARSGFEYDPDEWEVIDTPLRGAK
ncbi:hypothetical protein [Anaerocaecibacter muris]|uniref:hypothetical protein n=1 Tax=Anaerocaecibacter muris TaxID=2941513 RepID=UPI003F694A9E